MIVTQSHDLIALWHDIGMGWLSGQEPNWIDERIGSNYIAYNSLLVGRWDHRLMETEGSNLASLMKISSKSSDRLMTPAILTNGSYGLHRALLYWGISLESLRKKSGVIGFHVQVPVVEYPRDFFELILTVDSFLHRWKVPHMSPVAFHITMLKFSTVTMPFLLPVMGRRAFFDAELNERLNSDLDNLSYILSPDYPNKEKQEVWNLVKNHMGKEEVY